jgi:hypothetical protein
MANQLRRLIMLKLNFLKVVLPLGLIITSATAFELQLRDRTPLNESLSLFNNESSTGDRLREMNEGLRVDINLSNLFPILPQNASIDLDTGAISRYNTYLMRLYFIDLLNIQRNTEAGIAVKIDPISLNIPVYNLGNNEDFSQREVVGYLTVFINSSLGWQSLIESGSGAHATNGLTAIGGLFAGPVNLELFAKASYTAITGNDNFLNASTGANIGVNLGAINLGLSTSIERNGFFRDHPEVNQDSYNVGISIGNRTTREVGNLRRALTY